MYNYIVGLVLTQLMSYFVTSTHSPKMLLEATEIMVDHLYATRPVNVPQTAPTHVDFYLENVLKYHEAILKDLRKVEYTPDESASILERVGVTLVMIQKTMFGSGHSSETPVSIRECVDLTRYINKQLNTTATYGCSLQ